MTLPAERIVIMSPSHAAEPRLPVTAKLAYLTDLRELNELNFARFDAKLEQRLAVIRRQSA
jgi:hypothetical protein